MAHDCEIRTTIYLEKKEGNDIARKKIFGRCVKFECFPSRTQTKKKSKENKSLFRAKQVYRRDFTRKRKVALIFCVDDEDREERETFCRNDERPLRRGEVSPSRRVRISRGWRSLNALRRRFSPANRTGNRHETRWLGSTGTTRTPSPSTA